jgi:hypothetical protein
VPDFHRIIQGPATHRNYLKIGRVGARKRADDDCVAGQTEERDAAGGAGLTNGEGLAITLLFTDHDAQAGRDRRCWPRLSNLGDSGTATMKDEFGELDCVVLFAGKSRPPSFDNVEQFSREREDTAFAARHPEAIPLWPLGDADMSTYHCL